VCRWSDEAPLGSENLDEQGAVWKVAIRTRDQPPLPAVYVGRGLTTLRAGLILDRVRWTVVVQP
jgi:hypothetical protein